LLAFRAIRRHVLRSFLTVLGIVIGVFAVVTMVTLGNGTTQAVRQQISSLGANVLTVLRDRVSDAAAWRSPPPFKPEDVDAIRDQVTGITAVAHKRNRPPLPSAMLPTGPPPSTAPPTPISTRRVGL